MIVLKHFDGAADFTAHFLEATAGHTPQQVAASVWSFGNRRWLAGRKNENDAEPAPNQSETNND